VVSFWEWGRIGGPLGVPDERRWLRALLEAQPVGRFPWLRRVHDSVTEGVTGEESRSGFE
jgi:hypothetical protein